MRHGQVGYGHARAVINANCKKIKVGSSRVCSLTDVKRTEHHDIHAADSRSAVPVAADRMERLICRA